MMSAMACGDWSSWIAEALGADPALLGFGDRDRSPGDSDLIVADTRQLQDLLGWTPPQRLKPGLDPGQLLGSNEDSG